MSGAAAENLSRLEVEHRFDTLYDHMHPDAQQVIPREAVVGWYEEDFAPRGPAAAEATKVRFIPWTWAVMGRTYPETAEVAYRQRFADGSEERGEVRLVKDWYGNWSWFFGRSRAFVEEQISRFTAPHTTDTGAQPQELCASTADCSEVGGRQECVRVLGDAGFLIIICLRDTGGTCAADDDCLRTMTCTSGTCGSLLAGEARITTQDLALHADPPQSDLPVPGDQRYPPEEVPLLEIPAGSTVTLGAGGSVFGHIEVEYLGTTGWVLEEFLAPA